jgi:hypothetical protein
MTGKQGHSGGKRKGAGRPPSPQCKAVSLKPGDQYTMGEHYPDGGWTMPGLATVKQVSRTLIVLGISDVNKQELYEIRLLR